MKYIHCSWDILEPDSLVPRVPETIITGPNLTEDSKTPRICVAGSVQDALKSIPGCGIMIRNMRKYHIPLIIPCVLSGTGSAVCIQTYRCGSAGCSLYW